MVIAHPDDEIIFGWPILQDSGIKKKILCCSSDLNNPERAWCKHRKMSLFEVGQKTNSTTMCLDYNSEFYRFETRQETLSKMMRHVEMSIEAMKPFDYIFTHNYWGEYGHIDHIIINSVIINSSYPTIISDMFIKSNWVPFETKPVRYSKLFNESARINLNLSFYNDIKSIYAKSNVWTWSKDPIIECKIAEI